MFDFVGVGILVVLLVLFGWLTTRAWRAKQPVLKWAGSILSGLVTLIVAVVTGAALYGFAQINKTYKTLTPVAGPAK